MYSIKNKILKFELYRPKTLFELKEVGVEICIPFLCQRCKRSKGMLLI